MEQTITEMEKFEAELRFRRLLQKHATVEAIADTINGLLISFDVESDSFKELMKETSEKFPSVLFEFRDHYFDDRNSKDLRFHFNQKGEAKN